MCTSTGDEVFREVLLPIFSLWDLMHARIKTHLFLPEWYGSEEEDRHRIRVQHALDSSSKKALCYWKCLLQSVQAICVIHHSDLLFYF